MSQLCHFLLAYDHDQQLLIEQREFNDGDEAAAAYTVAEQKYRERQRIEIVLVGADSIETIMRTHGHYFDRSAVSPFLAGI